MKQLEKYLKNISKRMSLEDFLAKHDPQEFYNVPEDDYDLSGNPIFVSEKKVKELSETFQRVRENPTSNNILDYANLVYKIEAYLTENLCGMAYEKDPRNFAVFGLLNKIVWRKIELLGYEINQCKDESHRSEYNYYVELQKELALKQRELYQVREAEV